MYFTNDVCNIYFQVLNVFSKVIAACVKETLLLIIIVLMTSAVATFKSTVTSKNQPALTFTLELLNSESTFAQPKQTWQFTSDYAVGFRGFFLKLHLILTFF